MKRGSNLSIWIERLFEFELVSAHRELQQLDRRPTTPRGAGASPLVQEVPGTTTNGYRASEIRTRRIGHVVFQRLCCERWRGFFSCQPQESIFSDRLNHASLIDGSRLSRAQNDCLPPQRLESLKNFQTTSSRGSTCFCRYRFPIADGGDVPNLIELRRLLDEYDMLGILAEAHATGVYGQRGTVWWSTVR